jgi:hypothetical protein
MQCRRRTKATVRCEAHESHRTMRGARKPPYDARRTNGTVRCEAHLRVSSRRAPCRCAWLPRTACARPRAPPSAARASARAPARMRCDAPRRVRLRPAMCTLSRCASCRAMSLCAEMAVRTPVAQGSAPRVPTEYPARDGYARPGSACRCASNVADFCADPTVRFATNAADSPKSCLRVACSGGSPESTRWLYAKSGRAAAAGFARGRPSGFPPAKAAPSESGRAPRSSDDAPPGMCVRSAPACAVARGSAMEGGGLGAQVLRVPRLPGPLLAQRRTLSARHAWWTRLAWGGRERHSEACAS